MGLAVAVCPVKVEIMEIAQERDASIWIGLYQQNAPTIVTRLEKISQRDIYSVQVDRDFGIESRSAHPKAVAHDIAVIGPENQFERGSRRRREVSDPAERTASAITASILRRDQLHRA